MLTLLLLRCAIFVLQVRARRALEAIMPADTNEVVVSARVIIFKLRYDYVMIYCAPRSCRHQRASAHVVAIVVLRYATLRIITLHI